MIFRKKKKTDDSDNAGRRHASDLYVRNTVFSYHANRSNREGVTGRSSEDALESEKPVRSSKYSYKKIILRGLIIVVVLFLVGKGLQLSSDPNIVITGNSTSKFYIHNKSEYERSAQRLFAESILNHNKITVNASYIAEQLRQEYPELAAVSVTLPTFGSKPIVYILPAGPQLVLKDSTGEYLVLDNTGSVLLNEGQISSPSQSGIPIVSDQNVTVGRVGQLALPSTSVSFISEVSKQLQAEEVKTSSYNIPAGTSELDVTLTGEPYFARFNLYGNARVEAGTLLAVMQQLKQTNKTPSKYIDVMIEGRAYYL